MNMNLIFYKMVLYLIFVYSIYQAFIKFITKKGNHTFIIGGYSPLLPLILYIPYLFIYFFQSTNNLKILLYHIN